MQMQVMFLNSNGTFSALKEATCKCWSISVFWDQFCFLGGSPVRIVSRVPIFDYLYEHVLVLMHVHIFL